LLGTLHNSPVGATVVALCGVDGVGKTTLVEMIENRNLFPFAKYLKKDSSSISELVEKYHRRTNGFYDWNSGSFAAAVAVGAALDWLSYYDRVIAPLLSEHQFLVVDRYLPCYASYLTCTVPSIDPEALFHGTHPPDLVIMVDADDALLPDRYLKRGGAGEDENLQLMRMMRTGYARVIRDQNLLTRHVRNEGSIEETYLEVVGHINELLACRRDEMAVS
jgi:thymidylate kinase